MNKMIPLAFATIFAMLTATGAHASGRNLLVIIADDLGIDVSEFYPTSAGRHVTTPPAPLMPNLDALAQQGILFSNAWGNMECSPTRAALMTGRYDFRTGVGAYLRTGYPSLAPEEFTLAEAFRTRPDLGYQSAAVGKWHLSYGYTDPNTQGFDYYAGFLPGGGALGNYYNWSKITNGVRTNSRVYATTDQVNEAIGVIERAKEASQPSMLWLAFDAPHTPYHVPPTSLQSVAGLPPYADGVKPRPYYEAMVEAMDTEIGRLLSHVDLATTTVIFLGDNGTPGAVIALPYSRSKGKSTIYEGGIRVPLLIAGAGVEAPGRVVGDIVNIVDLFPTILELAGIDVVTALPPEARIDGVSLMPYIANTNIVPVRSWAYSEKFEQNYTDRFVRAIRNNTFKLIERADGKREFYNLAKDWRENTNILLRKLNSTERANLADLDQQMDALLATR